MRAFKRVNQGVTLVEMLLVLTIAGIILLLSLEQYKTWSLDAEISELNNNVDLLFLAAAGYYHANCNQGGALDPTIATNPQPINITTQLITPGFLSASFPAPNPLVDSTGPGGGYIVQYNEFLIPRYMPVCTDPPACTTSTPEQIGTTVIWQIQVAVLMKNTSSGALSANLNYLQGQCLSTTGSGGTVVPCSATNPTGNYVVFQRLPSYPSSQWNSGSPYWLSDPLLQQFNQMYTTNPMSDLTNQSHTPEYQYFYCSG